MVNLNFEKSRKSFHIMALLCPIIYYFIPKSYAVAIISLVALFVVYVDTYRHSNSFIQRWTLFFLKNIMRKDELETKKLGGSSWMFLGMAVSCILFSKIIVIFSWVVLCLCDSAAAIVGTAIGNTEIIKGKTFEGSLTFFVLTFILGIVYHTIFLNSFTFYGLLFASLGATYAELYSKKYGLDDNFTIPLAVCFFLSLI